MTSSQTAAFFIQIALFGICLLSGASQLFGTEQLLLLGLILWFVFGCFQLANSLVMAVRYRHRGFTSYFLAALGYCGLLGLGAFIEAFPDRFGPFHQITLGIIPGLMGLFYLLYYRRQCVEMSNQKTIPSSENDQILDDNWEALH